jgi:endonuclease YncB( thermonuclease family)
MTWRYDEGLVAFALIAGGTTYIYFRWRRAPQAYQPMMILAVVYLTAGGLLGSLLDHLARASSPTKPVAAVAQNLPGVLAMADTHRIAARVIGVTDGDTVEILESTGPRESVRLTGIDAPEHGQAFGSESTQNLSGLILQKSVTLDCENERSYGRLLCKILLPNGEDVDLDQVNAGMAWHYKQFQDEQSPADRALYAAAECTAMKAKVGLWSDPHPIQPQDFRHGTNSPLLFDGDGCRTTSEPSSGPVVGNSRSHIFEWPACPYYSAISIENRVSFPSPQAAESEGYRPAHNCP